MEYNFREIEKKWQAYWAANKTFKTDLDPSRPKFYVLDMFPYPSGAGLHVGHPLGYIASDIYSRYKTLKGFNVLHPMGYDAFGLPAEQYAIQTGQHPAITTARNIARYREQLDKIGFSYDWDREVRTSDPDYYHWTQWVFMQLFGHWYDSRLQKARPIDELLGIFAQNGNSGLEAACNQEESFDGTQWAAMSETEQETILLNYRLAYMADTVVNWCPALGTVLANDEVKEGVSVRGGHPVEQRKMKQWLLRVSAYARRLLDDLETLDWTESLKEIQRNWIGRSEGAQLEFEVEGRPGLSIFTTRPDTLFGCTFMVIAPESEILDSYVAPGYEEAVEAYRHEIRKRTERERMADTRKITGQFLGTYARHPFTGEPIPIWTSEYVLAGYGTGAIMAVPAHDARDYAFARHFGLLVREVVSGGDIETASYDAKEGILVNSGFLNGLNVPQAIKAMNDEIEKRGLGVRKINYRLRDAIFSRQRYWGEPFPVYFDETGLPHLVPESELPVGLPEVDAYLPTETGEPPLGRALAWKKYQGRFDRELSTMPGFAGSSAYYLRYMDPRNSKALVSREANAYWQDVDLYIGGTEHATGHLIYARFWNKFLFDLGLVCRHEPFRKLINQGMIQGRSNFVYRIRNSNRFVTLQKKDDYDTTPLHVDVNLVQHDFLDVEAFRKWNPEYENAEFILDDEGRYRCGWAVEKMSKSMYNVVNPDDIGEKYGADTLRLYEMFLGPLEQSKPWDTNGIEGVHKFLRKFWRLFHDRDNLFRLTDEEPVAEEQKVLHQTIRKIEQDITNFSFNTSVSTFMIATNQLTDLKCTRRAILEPMLLLLSPFAPHICEELWAQAGHAESIAKGAFPICEERFLVEDQFEYPVSVNGKLRFKLVLPLGLDAKAIENEVLGSAEAAKWLQGNPPKKVVVVPGRIINLVL